jgi:hypothetical protein
MEKIKTSNNKNNTRNQGKQPHWKRKNVVLPRAV